MCWLTILLLGLLAELSLAAQEAGNGVFPADSTFSTEKPDLSEAEQARLKTDKVLVSRQEVRQCFTAYMDGSYPRFVTSDAVLNAYHVLFEETLRQQEEMQSRHVRTLCKDLWLLLATAERMYRGDAAQIAAAKQRARFVIGVALCLQGDELGTCEADLKQAIEAEVAAIEKAEGQHKPPLLGPPEPDFTALDYTLFRPVGFYANTPRLQRYFRALRWLQLVPFRVDHAEELLAYHMLEMVKTNPVGWAGAKVDASLLPVGCDTATHERLYHAFLQREIMGCHFGLVMQEGDLTHSVISRQDQLPVRVDADFPRTHVEDVGRIQNAGRNTGNDRVRQTMPNAENREFRVLSAFRLPEDAALTFLGRLNNDTKTERSPGLEFMGWLGIPQAESLLQKQMGSKTMGDLLPVRPHIEDYGDAKRAAIPWWRRIYGGYMDVSLQYRAALRMLAEVDKRAPKFMQGELWRTKTLQTVAASWAQERHAWILQAKPEVHVMSAAPPEKGFVEPVPEFFLRLARVASLLNGMAANAEVNNDPVAPVIESLKEESRRLRETASSKATREEIFDHVWSASESLARFHGYGAGVDPDNATAADLKKLAAELDALSAELEHDARPGTLLWEKLQQQRIHTDQLWHSLEVLCLRLAMLAEKQLQQVPLNEDDQSFIQNIGYELSAIMLYRGQAMMFPLDDAPRIARIASDPRSGSVLQVGIGRPRLMFVLYPWQGKEILCRGVVMPYHEVRDKQTLTDAEWRQRQQGDSREGIPEWLRQLVPADEIVLKTREH
jgi:hypothetical protein